MDSQSYSITWQSPSTTTIHSYLPYSDHSFQQQQPIGHHAPTLLPPQPAPTLISLNDTGYHRVGDHLTKDIRQDSVLTTITTTAPPRLVHSAVTTLSMSEAIRKQRNHRCGRWVLFILGCSLFCAGGVVLFICLPRLPLVTMAPMADTFGQEPADWGPPLHPFYRTTWQLNLTFDNQPNFIPLHLVQMDMVLSLRNTSNTLASSNNMTNGMELVPFAWATLPDMTLKVDRQHETVNAIFHIDYVAATSNLTDPTFAQLFNACGPKNINNPPALNVSLHITFHILHYLWSPTMVVYPSEENDGLICPSN
ncbi:hypothetical protein BC941DRAFT_471891 [Chlamydoabsidia padenii]|nr:hypothetical protein BC941DRAFT_471891 [Chlamydoabsidia padenii]